MRILFHLFLLSSVVLLPACAKKKSAWDGTYEKVYQRRGENDSSYKAPSVVSCVDDDLYNCN